MTFDEICTAVQQERKRQPTAIVPQAHSEDHLSCVESQAKYYCDQATNRGKLSHRMIIAEEAAESYAAMGVYRICTTLGPSHQAYKDAKERVRAELIQLAACAFKALEQLDED